MKIISWKNLTRLSVGFVLMSLVCLLVTTVYIQRQTRLYLSAFAKDNSTHIPFEQEDFTAHPTNYIKFLQNTQNTRSLESFQGFIFSATDSGLLKFDEEGKLINHYTVLDGLPESDLISLATFQNKLFIGTRSRGLVSFDGRKFSRFFFSGRDTQAVTALLSEPRELLIGTFNGGLISYNGENFTEIFGSEKDERIYKINNLNKIGERLFVGTFDNGVWLLVGENERQHFTKTDGLLSNRIVGVAKIGKEIFVGTDLGISKADLAELSSGKKKFETQKVIPSLSTLSKFNEKIIASKANGEIFLFQKDLKDTENSIAWQNSGKLLESFFQNLQNDLFLNTNQGVFKVDGKSQFSVSFKKFNEDAENFSPAHNTISAIAKDKNENLWLGTFRNGIDVFDKKGKNIEHIETEQIRDINFLQKTENGITAATSQGVFSIDENFEISDFIKPENLPGKSVMHFSHDGNGSNSFATSRGFLTEENGQTRGFSTVNGLPANNIYATLQTGRTTFVGTIGGLAQIENGKIIRTFKDSNSELTTNWVTALCETNGRIFIGTYGGGAFELQKSGDIRNFSNETGKFFVNPNAMFSDGERIFVGTLKGVWIFDLKTEKWSHIKNVLPSETVLSIAGNSRETFIGTTAGVAVIQKNFWSK